MSVETVTYKGVRFRRYPDSPHDSCRNYFTPGQADKERGVKRLHQEVYEDNYGPIPPGYEVHHRDSDTLNNEPENLIALDRKEHKAQHPWSPERKERQREHLAAQQEKAAEWHASPAGREWHAEHARRIFAERDPKERECKQCGETFESVASRADFCTPSCAAKHRRDSGVDDVDRDCAICPQTFRVNKYAKTKTCSPHCAAALVSKTKRERSGSAS